MFTALTESDFLNTSVIMAALILSPTLFTYKYAININKRTNQQTHLGTIEISITCYNQKNESTRTNQQTHLDIIEILITCYKQKEQINENKSTNTFRYNRDIK